MVEELHNVDRINEQKKNSVSINSGDGENITSETVSHHSDISQQNKLPQNESHHNELLPDNTRRKCCLNHAINNRCSIM